MAVNLTETGLNTIVNHFDLFYIDIWGVLHNGIKLNEEAVNVPSKLDDLGKEYVLLTNAPRPNSTVKSFLKKLGIEEEIREHVFTSGEAALNYLKKNLSNKTFFHVGPPRDFDLFKIFENMKSDNIESSEYILCTGLFDEHNKDLNYYKNLFEKSIEKSIYSI